MRKIFNRYSLLSEYYGIGFYMQFSLFKQLFCAIKKKRKTSELYLPCVISILLHSHSPSSLHMLLTPQSTLSTLYANALRRYAKFQIFMRFLSFSRNPIFFFNTINFLPSLLFLIFLIFSLFSLLIRYIWAKM